MSQIREFGLLKYYISLSFNSLLITRNLLVNHGVSNLRELYLISYQVIASCLL